MDFPGDAHGDALRRIYADEDFNPENEYLIDFNVDFNSWPPSNEAIKILEAKYGKVDYYEDDDGKDGYLNVQINGLVSYDFIISKMDEISEMIENEDGYSNCWGVMTG